MKVEFSDGTSIEKKINTLDEKDKRSVLRNEIDRIENELREEYATDDSNEFIFSMYNAIMSGAETIQERNQYVLEQLAKTVAPSLSDEEKELVEAAMQQMVAEEESKDRLEEELIWKTGNITVEFYEKKCKQLYDCFQWHSNCISEMEQKIKSDRINLHIYTGIKGKCMVVINVLEQADEVWHWKEISDSCRNVTADEINGYLSEMEKLKCSYDLVMEKIDRLMEYVQSNPLVGSEEESCSEDKKTFQESEDAGIDTSIYHFLNGWSMYYIMQPLMLQKCYCTRTNLEYCGENIESFVRKLESIEPKKKITRSDIEEWAHFWPIVKLRKIKSGKKIKYLKGSEKITKLWLTTNKMSSNIHSRTKTLRDNMKALFASRDLFLDREGNCFSRVYLVPFTDAIYDTNNVDYIYGMNAIFPAVIVNVVVDSLFDVWSNSSKNRKLFSKTMVEEFENNYTKKYAKEFLKKKWLDNRFKENSWINTAGVFELLCFICSCFHEIGATISWVFAVEYAENVLYTFVSLLDERKQDTETTTKALRALVASIWETSHKIVDIYKAYKEKYENIIEEKDVNEDEGYILLGEERQKVILNREETILSYLEEQQKYYRQPKETVLGKKGSCTILEEKYGHSSSVNNRIYKLLWQMLMLSV